MFLNQFKESEDSAPVLIWEPIAEGAETTTTWVLKEVAVAEEACSEVEIHNKAGAEVAHNKAEHLSTTLTLSLTNGLLLNNNSSKVSNCHSPCHK
jgi:hypothetical protein